MLLTASRVVENRQIRKSTKEILRSEFRSKNEIGQEKFIFNRKLYHSTFFMPRIGSFGPPIRMKYKLELDHVIRVAVNKHVFVETNLPSCHLDLLTVYSSCKLKTRQDERKGIKQLLFIQIHLWHKK